MMHAEILDGWGHYPARVDQLEQLLGALDTWKQWAQGQDGSRPRLSESAAVINHVAVNWQHRQLTEVAAAVERWSRKAGLDLPPKAPGPRQPSPGLVRGLGLEL